MKSSTIRIKHGIHHSACGKGLKTVNKTFYSRWQGMRSRTTNPKASHYQDYGGRGIKSDEFALFIDFYDSMYESFCEKSKEIGEQNVSLERIDVNGDYTKENCTWIHIKNQHGNCRKTKKFYVTFPDGHTEYCESVIMFAKQYNLDTQSIYDCISGKYAQHRGFKFKKADEGVSLTEVKK